MLGVQFSYSLTTSSGNIGNIKKSILDKRNRFFLGKTQSFERQN